MKTIKLSRGKVALVDDEDYDRLSKFAWHAVKQETQNTITWYAVHSVKANGTNIKWRMHRVILGVIDLKMIVDHKDHDGLNNQRHNLRAGTQLQNTGNRRKQPGTSIYKGVCSYKNKWMAQIQHNHKHINLGYFDSEIDAAKAYDKKSKELFGEFAHSSGINL